jgi:5'-nucleotidase (lipoprotein e(P4) family)
MGTQRVVEAVGRGVVSTELQDFLQRSSEWVRGRVLVGRTKERPETIRAVISFALQQQGLPYDEVFEAGNSKWYCSELIDAAFASAAGLGLTYFGLAPMTFRDSLTRVTHPYWQHYFDSLGIPVPEGRPGINPGSMSLSNRLRLFLLSGDPTPGTMDGMLLSALYVQRSAEYKALCRQTYRSAAQQLAILVDSVQRTNEAELRTRPAAVVLDLDETVLDNSLYAGWQIRHGSVYSSESWQAWVSRCEATAVPGAMEYLQSAGQMGLQILYLSNRQCSQWQATRRNMLALGLPVDGLDSMWLRDRIRDKQARRDSIIQRYTVLQWVGDNLMDMQGFKAYLTEQERDLLVAEQGHRLGRDWVLLPNPVYGPWEDLWHIDSGIQKPELLADQDVNEQGNKADPSGEQRKLRLVKRLRFFRP